jgi:hypothetical protein
MQQLAQPNCEVQTALGHYNPEPPEIFQTHNIQIYPTSALDLIGKSTKIQQALPLIKTD